jgi:CcmD family protein
MTTLALAFGFAWIAVASYAGWLGAQNRQLARRLDALESEQSASNVDPYSARAA